MSAEQAGLIYYILPQYIATPNTLEGLRIYRSTVDNLYYVKKSDGTSELLSIGIGGTNSQFRGGWDASLNTFPATGGSGAADAILAGDSWVITVSGILCGEDVIQGDLIIALVNSPAQICGNWTIIENNIGYVPENVANKATDFTIINNTLYPSVQAVNNELVANYEPILGFTPENVANKATDFTIVNNTLYPTVQAVVNELANYEPALGFTPEDVANKATDFTIINNTLYPSVQAVNNQITATKTTYPYVEKTATYTIVPATDYTINATANSFTVNLPTAVGITGQVFVIKNSGLGLVTVDGNAAELIDGQLTQSINPTNSIMVQSTGVGWIVI